MGKSYIVNSYRGITRVQAWPRKRGPAKTEDERLRQAIFTMWQGLYKRLHPREIEADRAAIEAHNRTHRGQRGSAAIRLRDWVTQRLYGRGIAVTTDFGVTFWPPAVHRDASLILDHVTDTPSDLLQRGGQEWQGTGPGSPGNLLTAGPAGSPATWQP
jgi:hypothetical protein